MRNLESLPPINKRISDLVFDNFGGNVRKFSLNMGLSDSSKINRLFKPPYPIPSTEIVLLISNAYNVTTDWILKGVEEDKHVNNININTNDVNGNGNTIVGDENSGNISNTNDKLLDIIENQHNQISELIKCMKNG